MKTERGISPNRRAITATAVRDAIAADLSVVKSAERLTDEEIGEGIGKSKDQAEAYRKGDSEMSASTFWRAVREFGPGFGNGTAALAGFRLEAIYDPRVSDKDAPLIVGAALMKLLQATADGSEIDQTELFSARSEILALGAVADSLRQRLTANAVRAA